MRVYWFYYSFFNLHSKDDLGKTESFFSLVYWLGLKQSWGRTRVRGIWSVAFHLEWGKGSLKSPSNLTFISPGLEFALMVISTSNVRIEAVNIHSLIFYGVRVLHICRVSQTLFCLLGVQEAFIRISPFPPNKLSRGYGTSEVKNGLLEMWDSFMTCLWMKHRAQMNQLCTPQKCYQGTENWGGHDMGFPSMCSEYHWLIKKLLWAFCSTE